MKEVNFRKRILVYGVTGSGKTTLAEKIALKTGLPWYEVDFITWEPGWEQVPLEVQKERIREICAREEWILDTAYGQWLDIPLERAQLIVGLDFPRWLSLGRLVKRCIQRVIDKKQICNGNVETLKGIFSRESLILWHFRSFTRKRDRMRHWATFYEGPEVVLLNSPKSAERWLQTLGPELKNLETAHLSRIETE